MENTKCLMHRLAGCFVVLLGLGLFAGCKTEQSSSGTTTSTGTGAAVATAAPAVEAAAANVPNPMKPPIRIKAGLTTQFTDSEGNVWLPDQGFADGETTERDADLQVANTKDPALYRCEHYSMTSFSYPVPNGKYIVKLHFAETYDGISGPGDRVFSFNVQGHQFNDFDVWVKAGGANRAYIETVPVDVTNGKVDITFTPKVENPQINGIEILPAS
ncbi:MAG TPA: malectin [Verrucomicrobiae bacterium]|nr:malectin [Verrucomicrobiae bacterium]